MRPFYDLAGAFAAQIFQAEKEAGRVYEAMIGIVTENKDPQKLGRVKVKVPVLSDRDTTCWAPIVMLGAGKNRGWFFIPEVDDEVLVMFEHGNVDRPLVVGSLWNGKDAPPDRNTGGNPRRVIKSRQGSTITFDDEQMKLVIEDGTKMGRITFESETNKITIEALSGDVCFQSPTGDTQIVAQTMELTAKQNVEIHAGSAMAWGTDASLAMKSSGSVTISGSKSNTNCAVAQMPQAPEADPKDVPDPYEARPALGGGATSQAPAAPASSSVPSRFSPPAATPAIPAAPSEPTSPPAAPPLEPQPVLVSAAWGVDRAPVSTAVDLSALASEMSGKAATMTIRDADDESAVIATLSAAIGDDSVETSWTTPASGPPGRFTFEVAADGKHATSGVLTLVNDVEVTLLIDEEPAAGVRVRLRAEPSREEVTAESDEAGVVKFTEAPFGDYTLVLDES